MTTKTSTRGADATETTLLARMGLPRSASAQDVEAAHDELIGFLDTAPTTIAGWSGAQIAAIEQAYVLLSDPTIDRSALMASTVAAADTAATTTRAERPAAAAPAALPAAAKDRRVRRLAIGAAVVVGVVAIAFAGFNLNGGTGVPPMTGSPAPEAAASPAVDTARVGELMQKIQADPKDVTSLQSLADIYYQANDYATAGGFLEKIVGIDPKNVTALLALGAVQYNQGDTANAEKQWRAVLAMDDQNIDAHYYLGFMFLTQDPPDTAQAKAEWNKVIAIDPTSDIAKNVSQHMASLDATPAPGASGAAPASQAPAVSPAASPAVVASPAAN
jgi:cytochrome c-type biogenesis protein CcmH/NrfG